MLVVTGAYGLHAKVSEIDRKVHSEVARHPVVPGLHDRDGCAPLHGHPPVGLLPVDRDKPKVE